MLTLDLLVRKVEQLFILQGEAKALQKQRQMPYPSKQDINDAWSRYYEQKRDIERDLREYRQANPTHIVGILDTKLCEG